MRADLALKSLPWVDHHNYRIVFDDQMVHIRVADMKSFDQKKLVKAFLDKQLEPTWLETIAPRPDFPTVAERVLANASVKAIEGEWRTDDCAPRKFWLNIQDGMIRLHTTKLGDWTSAQAPILDAGDDWIRSELDSKKMELKHEKAGDALIVHVTSPSVFQGDFRLVRE